MATTTNFGWTTPDDTDLVKDGALAIRTLGNNIDTSLLDLKGGTTGQLLSKTSNTDLDFTWTNPPTSGYTLLNTTTLSNTTSINNVFSSTYSNYLIIGFQTLGSTGGDGIGMRLRVSGSDSTTNYLSFDFTTNLNMTTEWQPGTINSTTEGFFQCTLFNPFAAKATGMTSVGMRNAGVVFRNGLNTATTSYDGITIYPTGGTLAGIVKIYGIAN